MHRTVLILVLEGVADGAVGISLDVIAAANRVELLGLLGPRRVPRVLEGRLVSLDGTAVRTQSGRRLEVDGAATLRGRTREDVLVVPGLAMGTTADVDVALRRGAAPGGGPAPPARR